MKETQETLELLAVCEECGSYNYEAIQDVTD